MNAASERLMVGMLERVGLDPAIAEISDPDTIVEFSIKAVMEEIRQRCRACPNVNVCEQWLAGNKDCDNVFCPNERVFKELKIICDDVARLGHS